MSREYSCIFFVSLYLHVSMYECVYECMHVYVRSIFQLGYFLPPSIFRCLTVKRVTLSPSASIFFIPHLLTHSHSYSSSPLKAIASFSSSISCASSSVYPHSLTSRFSLIFLLVSRFMHTFHLCQCFAHSTGLSILLSFFLSPSAFCPFYFFAFFCHDRRISRSIFRLHHVSIAGRSSIASCWPVSLSVSSLQPLFLTLQWLKDVGSSCPLLLSPPQRDATFHWLTHSLTFMCACIVALHVQGRKWTHRRHSLTMTHTQLALLELNWKLLGKQEHCEIHVSPFLSLHLLFSPLIFLLNGRWLTKGGFFLSLTALMFNLK